MTDPSQEKKNERVESKSSAATNSGPTTARSARENSANAQIVNPNAADRSAITISTRQ